MLDDTSNALQPGAAGFDDVSADRRCSIGADRVTRDDYGALTGRVGPFAVDDIKDRFAPALPESYVNFDRARRGDAVNRDVYGYDDRRDLAVIQVRHFFRRHRYHYANVRKAYFLVGYTEAGAPFRHPVSGHAIHAAIRGGATPTEVVQAAERWIFRVTPAQHARSVRQGDILMIPARGRPSAGSEAVGQRLLLLDSHEIRAHEIVRDTKGEIWAYDPAVYHLKGQHAPLYAPDVDGWWILRPGREGTTYDFGERLGD